MGEHIELTNTDPLSFMPENLNKSIYLTPITQDGTNKIIDQLHNKNSSGDDGIFQN